MLEINAHLTFISDPGHGWLRVPLADIAALGIEGDISEYSFINGRFAYLEEDCDYGRFVTACNAQDIPLPDIHRTSTWNGLTAASPALAIPNSHPNFGRSCGGNLYQ